MIVAVTGINSALGKLLIPKLQAEPSIEKIIGIDLNEYRGNSEKIQFFKIDVRDKNGMERVLDGIDVIIHLAFIVNPKKIPKKKIIYDINVNGSKTVFQAAAKNKVKKIIYTSSQSVYGHVPEVPKYVDENSPRLGIKTTNFYYSHTKALVEQYLDQFEQEFPDIAVIRFRPPIISGISFIENLGLFSAKGKTKRTVIPRNHQGRAPYQFVHEDDLTDVIMIAVKKDIRGAFNVASNVVDLNEFYKAEYGIKIKPLPYILVNFLIKFNILYRRAVWLQAIKYYSLLKTEKIENELGWKPKFSTEDCIKEIKSLQSKK